MRAGWSIKTMGEVGTFQRGGGFLKSDFVENGFPCIHYGQIHMKLGAATYTHFTSIPPSVAAKSKIASTGDVIIAITSEDVEGSCKSTAWMGDYDIAIGAHAAIFKHNLNPLFVSYYIQSCYFQKEKEAYTHGFKVVEIKPSDIAKIPIRFPSLHEQQRIVDILDQEFAKIDALKANAEKSLQAVKDLFLQILAETFSNPDWTRKRIGEVFDTGAGGTPLKTYKEYYENGDIPWLRSGEVCQKYITETEMFITQLGMDNSSAKMFPKNSVVVAMYGATAGQVGILHLETTTNQAICGIFPKEDYVPEFIYYSLLNSKKGLVAQATGNAQPNISQIKIKNTFIPTISRKEQEEIVARLDDLNDKCNTLQDNYQKTLALCDDLKQALLRKAFNGEL